MTTQISVVLIASMLSLSFVGQVGRAEEVRAVADAVPAPTSDTASVATPTPTPRAENTPAAPIEIKPTPEQEEFAFISILSLNIKLYKTNKAQLLQQHPDVTEAFLDEQCEVWKTALEELAQPGKALSVENRWHAARTHIYTLRDTMDPTYRTVAEKYFSETFYECESLASCLQLNVELATMVNTFPELISKEAFADKIRSSLNNLKFPFATDLLTFRFNTLFARARFYHTSKVREGENFGTEPRIHEPEYSNLVTELTALTDENSYWRKSPLTEDQIFACLILKQTLVKEENLDCLNLKPGKKIVFETTVKKMPEAEVKKLKERSKDLFFSLERSYHGAVSLRLYLTRVNRDSPNALLDQIKSAIEIGIYTDAGKGLLEDPIAAYMMLHEFSDVEFMLPSRQTWGETLKNLSTVLKKDLYPFLNIDALTMAQLENLKGKEEGFKAFADKFFLTSWFSNDENFSLADKEKFLRRHFPMFKSLTYHRARLVGTFAYISLLQAIAHNSKAPIKKEKLTKQIADLIPGALEQSLTLACYGYWLPSGSSKESKRDPSQRPEHEFYYVSPFNSGEQCKALDECSILAPTKKKTETIDWKTTKLKYYDLRRVCGADYKKTESSVSHFVSAENVENIMKQRDTIIKMKFIELGLMGVSSTGAGLVSRPVGNLARRAFVAGANRLAKKSLEEVAEKTFVETSLFFLADKFGPHAVHALVGAGTFTAIQHGALAGMGYIPWYDNDPDASLASNLWRNYGEQLLTGSAIFFFAPMVQTRAYELGLKWAGLAKMERWQVDLLIQRKVLTLGQEARLTTAKLAGDTLVFGSIPYVDRTIRSFINTDHDDIIQDGGHTLEELADAFLVATFFHSYNHTALPLINRLPVLNRFNLSGRINPLIFEELRKDRIDHYRILGVGSDISDADLKAHVRRTLRDLHPDKEKNKDNPASLAQFKAVTDSAEALADPAKRRSYDLLGKLLAQEDDPSLRDKHVWLTQIQDLFEVYWRGGQAKEAVNPFEGTGTDLSEPKRLGGGSAPENKESQDSDSDEQR